MSERNINKIMLEQYARQLYSTAGKVNLYINLYCEKRNPDIERLKTEIEVIKGLVDNIEMELDNI